MPELLGTASFPSGDLLLIDFGLLRLWSGEQPPVFPEGCASPRVEELANTAVDYEITGRQAREAAARANLAVIRGRYAFDVPPTGPSIADAVAGTGLDATVTPIERMPHHNRVMTLLDEDPDGVIVPFHGIWSVAVRGVPTGPLRVLGERTGDFWNSVWAECAPGEPVKSVEAGFVLVDRARLMFADPTALNHWVSDEPANGLFDLAFWGRDADKAAESLDASKVDSGYLWANMTADELRPRYRELERLREQGLKVVEDLRPHDDHHRLLTPMRAAGTDSGTVEVGGALMTGWFTGGDGGFHVYRDLAEDGTLLRVRVELGE